MRKLLFTGAIAFSLLMFACKPSGNKLVGKWTVAECSISNLDSLRRSQLMDVPDSLLTEAKGRLEGQIKSFLDDAKKETYNFERETFEISRRGKTDKGIWKISSDMKMIFLIPGESPAAEVIRIESMSGKQIKFSKKLTAESNAEYTLQKE